MLSKFKKSKENQSQSFRFLLNTLFWNKKITSILKEFAKLEIIKDTKLTEMQFSKLNKKAKWENIEDLISDFIICLPFNEKTPLADQTMMINFMKFTFYELAYKSFVQKINLNFLVKSPYNAENKIELNKYKRRFYYDFLDSFKYKNNYNMVLIKLLRILL